MRSWRMVSLAVAEGLCEGMLAVQDGLSVLEVIEVSAKGDDAQVGKH